MSTNYYLRNREEYENSVARNNRNRFKIEKIIEDIKEVIADEEEVMRIKRILIDKAEISYEEVHIGKRSGGWKPSFQKQPQFDSVKKLKEFYYENLETYEIVDEYDEVMTWADLEEQLISWEPNGKEEMYDSYKDEDGYVWHLYEYS